MHAPAPYTHCRAVVKTHMELLTGEVLLLWVAAPGQPRLLLCMHSFGSQFRATDQLVEGQAELLLELRKGQEPTCWDPVNNTACQGILDCTK